jgi:hypothetical protein
MKLYIVTLFDPTGLRDKVIKIFSAKENLDKWMQYANLMHRELYGDGSYNITKDYRISEAELDNLDFMELFAEAKHLGANLKPSQPQ